ncbi:hypothetical protein FB567DRAFT_88469 [Paraphoma chrysanthemicola]|uniref:Uncharacterized protein n=1 Tax=Paraphoma chrysanthemicola TaxID=798071 RepID=A0A8K0R2K3_9PLEO|nr:hypothetical protein FB567DRAFT_88469 [Paraphoma chrysanthemicola]
MGAHLKQLMSTFSGHLRTASKILQSSEDTKVMILTIINHRHNDTIRMHTSSLDSFMARAAIESERRTEIASKALTESSLTRIATIVTVFYLPFNLTAAFFSTDLITYHENGSLKIRKAVWLFVATTLFVMGSTAVAFWLCKRAERKKKIVKDPLISVSS